MLKKLKERVNTNKALVARGKWVNLTFVFGIDKKDYFITIQRGRIISIDERRLATDSGQFIIRASRTSWLEHWRPLPKRDYHDIWSMLPKTIGEYRRRHLAPHAKFTIL